jgi:hypothetical protein
MVPASSDCRPKEGNEFACPDVPRVESPVEFEVVVVLFKVVFLQTTPVLCESTLEYLLPANFVLCEEKSLKFGVISAVFGPKCWLCASDLTGND